MDNSTEMQKAEENCTTPAECRGCHSAMRVVSDNVSQCVNPDCFLVWERDVGWDPVGKAERQEKMVRYDNERCHPLQLAAQYLGRSRRSIYDHIQPGGHIAIGLRYIDGHLVITVDGQMLVSTTLAGGAHIFPVPPGTHYSQISVCSGPVMSGEVSHHQYFQGKHKKVEVVIPPWCSGVNIGASYRNGDGNLLAPPLIPSTYPPGCTLDGQF